MFLVAFRWYFVQNIAKKQRFSLLCFSRGDFILKNMYKSVLENSLAWSLIVGFMTIVVMMIGTIQFTTFQQMFVIIVAMYGFCKLYQEYRKEFNVDFLLVGEKEKTLEKLFAVLAVVLLSIGIYVDIQMVSRW